MVDIREQIDRIYRRIEQLQQQIRNERMEIQRYQDACVHRIEDGWCVECDKLTD